MSVDVVRETEPSGAGATRMTLRARRSPAEKAEDPTELEVLTEIRDLLAAGRT